MQADIERMENATVHRVSSAALTAAPNMSFYVTGAMPNMEEYSGEALYYPRLPGR